MDISNIIRKYGARFFATWLAGFAAWLYAKFGIHLDAQAQAEISAAALTIMVMLFQFIYSFGHKFINKWLNPGDAASSVIINKEKSTDTQLRAIGGE